ncbi:hypothetical protein ABO04_00600 [Nitrosomonas sp. HPC101]|uniref:hypothetical protein n=1 Tax=Nitrosomonas sp. HPC101 TaxID=1658667 RepID=UPI00136854B9|nr:hypothetical protein [Nitrosomonas sp. HPC101]MXS84446.1 hypothetical protein [Nitrosomonas sp. HPC101]
MAPVVNGSRRIDDIPTMDFTGDAGGHGVWLVFLWLITHCPFADHFLVESQTVIALSMVPFPKF